MPSCCHGDEYGTVFSARAAAATAARYRRRGLRGSARQLAAAVSAHAPPGATMLEVGGGAGQIGVALLESGVVASVRNIELSASWEAAARRLLEDRGLEDRVERIVGDFVDEYPGVPAADVVVLHRVICCYPDWEGMLTAARARAGHMVAFTIPVCAWWTRAAVRIDNLAMRIRGLSFRSFVHPPEAMIDRMTGTGFVPLQDRSGPTWRTVVTVRTG